MRYCTTGGPSLGRDLEVHPKSQMYPNRSSQDALLPDFRPVCVTNRRLLFDRLISCCLRRGRLSRRVGVPGKAKWKFCVSTYCHSVYVCGQTHLRTRSQHAATSKMSRKLFCCNGENVAASGLMRRVGVESVFPLCANTH